MAPQCSSIRSSLKDTLLFWRRMSLIRKVIWPKLFSVHTLFLLLQIALGVVYGYTNNYLSNNAGTIVTKVASGDIAGFYRISFYMFLVCVAGTLANSLILASGEYQYMGLFRTSLTKYVTQQYIQNKAYFNVLQIDRSIQDPDARISQDVEMLCDKLRLITVGTPMYIGYIGNTITCAYYVYTLTTQAGWGVVLACIMVFVFFALTSNLLTRKPADATRKVEEHQAKYYHAQTYFAMHAEHVAFLNGEQEEESKLRLLSVALVPLVRRVAWLYLPLNTWTICYYWAVTFYSYFVPGCVWLWTSDPLARDYGTVMNIAGVAYSFFDGMTTYLLLSAVWSELFSATARVCELLELIDSINGDSSYKTTTTFLDSTPEEGIRVKGVTLLRPGTEEPMIKDISLEVGALQSVVIMGPSGVGKTSILRVLAELWPARGGTIARTMKRGRGGVMFVPQKPYLTPGTLPAQVVYPDSPEGSVVLNGMTYVECLKQVGLGYLLKRYSETQILEWNQVLSVGEQQRLGIARVLYHQPAIAVMDESTSAIDEPNEEKAFLALKRLRIPLLSVAHRSTVRRFHDVQINILADGNWTSKAIEERFSDSIGAANNGAGATTADDDQPPTDAEGAGLAIESSTKKKFVFIRRLFRILRICWPTWKSHLTVIFIAELGLSLGYAWSYNYISNNIAQIVQAINDANSDAFYKNCLYMFLVAFFGAAVNSIMLSLAEYQFMGSFRRSLTEYVTDKYIQNKSYFKVLLIDRTIVDPDARIAQDIGTLCHKLRLIIIGTPMYSGYLSTTFCVAYFTYTLVQSAGWIVPMVALGIFAAFSIISALLTIKPSKTSRKVHDANAQYRYAQSYFAMHCEHIAFLRGEDQEESKLNDMVDQWRSIVRRVALLYLPLNSWNIFFYWGYQFLAYFIPGCVWLWSHDPRANDETILTNVGGVIQSLLSVTSNYILLSAVWSETLALTGRVMELVELVERIEMDPNYKTTTHYELALDPQVDINSVTLLRPGSGKPMISNVSLKVTSDQSVVIMGPSGVGKTSILRVLAELWPARGGTIVRPLNRGRGGMMFVPQKPYLTFGTLLAQVFYPDHDPSLAGLSPRNQDDEAVPLISQPIYYSGSSSSPVNGDSPEVRNLNSPSSESLSTISGGELAANAIRRATTCLKDVGLDYLLGRFPQSEVREWNQVLSVGEQQRLGIARVLYHEPAIAVMDESTSAIDEPNEERVFRALRRRRIALLSVAHRSTVKKFHNLSFLITADGSWIIEPISPLSTGSSTTSQESPPSSA